MIQSTDALWATIAMIVGLVFFSQRFAACKLLGPAVLSIFSGIVLANMGVLPRWHAVYGSIMGYALPLALALFMLSINLNDIKNLKGKPLTAIAISLVTVSFMGFVGAFLFHDSIPEIFKFTGMFIGTYTGGSANLAAAGVALNATPDQLAQANGADYIVGMPVLISFYLVPRLILQSSRFKRWYPYQLDNKTLDGDSKGGLFEKMEWSVGDIAVLMALAFGLVFVGDWASHLAAPELQKTVMILTLTTLSLILGQFKAVQRLKGSVDMGVYLYAFFLVVIGSLVDIPKFFAGVPTVAVYCAWTIFGSLLLYILLCRWFKVPLQYLVIAFVASIADGSTSAVIAASNRWTSLVGMAILLGMIGATIGSYAGIGLAWQIKALGL